MPDKPPEQDNNQQTSPEQAAVSALQSEEFARLQDAESNPSNAGTDPSLHTIADLAALEDFAIPEEGGSSTFTDIPVQDVLAAVHQVLRSPSADPSSTFDDIPAALANTEPQAMQTLLEIPSMDEFIQDDQEESGTDPHATAHCEPTLAVDTYQEEGHHGDDDEPTPPEGISLPKGGSHI